MGTHKQCLAGALLISTQNICFCGEIRKIFIRYLLLSRAMMNWIPVNVGFKPNHALRCGVLTGCPNWLPTWVLLIHKRS